MRPLVARRSVRRTVGNDNGETKGAALPGLAHDREIPTHCARQPLCECKPDARAEKDVGGVEQDAAVLHSERPEREPAARSPVNSPGNIDRGGDTKHDQEKVGRSLTGAQREAIDGIKEAG